MTCALVAFGAAGAHAQGARSAQGGATLAGVVRDSAGKPVADAEVILRDANRATRSNDRGEFTLGGVTPGAYQVWFRRLGFSSVQYNWAAKDGERIEIVVAMTPIAKTLDPVVVRADEDKRAKARASILGLVVDSAGTPVEEAEVQLVGAKMSGVTRANGGFLFRPLGVGAYVIRVRKLGYAPNMVTLQLVEGDDREVVIRLRPLAAGLDPVVVTERSGYGKDDVLYQELERRKSWVNFKSRFLGPEDLKGYYGLPLDYATIRMGLYNPTPSARSLRPMSINGAGTSSRPDLSVEGDACILLNGKDPVVQPLRTFSTDDVELLEVYPSGTELTGTVGYQFHRPRCVRRDLLAHPTYYVLWLKGRDK